MALPEPKIKTTNITLTPELSEYLSKRLETLSRLIDPEDTAVNCDVELGRSTEHHQTGDVYRAEINLMTDGKLFRAEATGETIHAAIDEVKDEIVHELRRHKDKKTHLLRRGGIKLKALLHGVHPRHWGIGRRR